MAPGIGPVRRAAVAAALVILLGALAPVAGAQDPAPSLPLARDTTARRIVDTALASLVLRQRSDGLFRDQTGRVVGGEGLPSLAFVALARAREDGAASQATRPGALGPAAQAGDAAETPVVLPATLARRVARREAVDPDAWLRTLARRTLSRGSGSSVVLRWPLAMLVGAQLENELGAAEGGALRGRLLTWNRLHAAGIASDRCYQDARCFNNYKLADAVLNLELVRSGLHSPRRHTRLHDPAGLRRKAVRWLRTALPAKAPLSGRVVIPGRRTELAALVSDPGTWPLPYAALCTAWVVRATRLAGRGAPAALRRTARGALWALLGAAGPDGDLSWSGRGQGQAWSLSAALYAASAGSALFADTDPQLAARLRRLADLELDALDRRLRSGELQVLPSGNTELQGLDHYYSVTGSTGLALAWLQMARDELPRPDAPRLRTPAEIDGASFTDARVALVVRRTGRTWLALRRRRDHTSDPRSDSGLMRALRLSGGVWREQLPERPGPVSHSRAHPQHTPSGGPVLAFRGYVHFQPRAAVSHQRDAGVDLEGVWRALDGRGVPGAWRYTGGPSGVVLRSTCPVGARLEVTAWLPRRGVLLRDGGLIQRAGYALRASPVPAVRALASAYANGVQPRLRAYRVVIPCRGPFATVTWSGGAAVGPGSA